MGCSKTRTAPSLVRHEWHLIGSDCPKLNVLDCCHLCFLGRSTIHSASYTFPSSQTFPFILQSPPQPSVTLPNEAVRTFHLSILGNFSADHRVPQSRGPALYPSHSRRPGYPPLHTHSRRTHICRCIPLLRRTGHVPGSGLASPKHLSSVVSPR